MLHAGSDEPAGLLDGVFEGGVDDEGVVQVTGGGELDFVASLCKAPLDRLFLVTTTGFQATIQLLLAGRKNEEHEGARHGGTDLVGSLDVDVEDHKPPLGQSILDRLAGGPVGVLTEDLGRFQELAGLEHGREAIGVDECVVFAVHFFPPSGSGRDRDAEDPIEPLLDPVRNGGLAHPGGAGDHQQEPG